MVGNKIIKRQPFYSKFRMISIKCFVIFSIFFLYNSMWFQFSRKINSYISIGWVVWSNFLRDFCFILLILWHNLNSYYWPPQPLQAFSSAFLALVPHLCLGWTNNQFVDTDEMNQIKKEETIEFYTLLTINKYILLFVTI
jgi:hypothetical protein